MYRTINETLKIIKESDKETAITLYYLRTLCKSGEIHVLNAGGKFLIDVNSLSEYLKMNLGGK